MKVLSLEEMNSVSGAYSWGSVWDIFGNIAEAALSATMGAAGGFATGATIGGKHGGDGGGMLGLGTLGQGVGMIGAGIIGAVTCSIAATIVGFDKTLEYSKLTMDNFLNGVFVP